MFIYFDRQWHGINSASAGAKQRVGLLNSKTSRLRSIISPPLRLKREAKGAEQSMIAQAGKSFSAESAVSAHGSETIRQRAVYHRRCD